LEPKDEDGSPPGDEFTLLTTGKSNFKCLLNKNAKFSDLIKWLGKFGIKLTSLAKYIPPQRLGPCESPL